MANESDTSFKRGFFTELKAEFRKIIWPEKTLLQKQSVAVVIASIVIGVIVALIDFLMQVGISYIIG